MQAAETQPAPPSPAVAAPTQSQQTNPQTSAQTAIAKQSSTGSHRPFIDPMSINAGWFWILIPLSLCISVAYKAIRVHDIRTLPRQAIAMTIQLILGVAAIGALAYIVIEKLLPMIAPVRV